MHIHMHLTILPTTQQQLHSHSFKHYICMSFFQLHPNLPASPYHVKIHLIPLISSSNYTFKDIFVYAQLLYILPCPVQPLFLDPDILRHLTLFILLHEFMVHNQGQVRQLVCTRQFIQYVQLGKSNGSVSIHHVGVTQQYNIQPATPPWSPCGHSKLCPTRLKQLPSVLKNMTIAYIR